MFPSPAKAAVLPVASWGKRIYVFGLVGVADDARLGGGRLTPRMVGRCAWLIGGSGGRHV